MLRKPTMVVPDDENEEWNPSNNSNNSNNNIPSQSARPMIQTTFPRPSSSSSSSSTDLIIDSPEPEPTMSHLTKMAATSRRHSKWPPIAQRMSQSSGHFATSSHSATTSLPRLMTQTGLHKMTHFHESQSMHSSTIDHQSLLDALHSENDQDDLRRHQRQQKRKASHSQGQEQERNDSTTTTTDDDDSFDRDSIELAVSGSSSGDGHDGNKYDDYRHLIEQDEEDDDIMVENVGSETLMELLGAQKDLEQQMHAIEQQENENERHHYHHSQVEEQDKEEFEMPSFIRILYMGEASEKDKRIFLKKLSQAFATLFHYDTPSWLRNPQIFKERKHHLLLMSLIPPDDDEEEEQDNLIETCEDNGLSVIEADFTWSTPVATETNDLTSMIERYVWLQCESARQNPTSWKATHITHDHRNKFDGFVYPDKAPNGIDLCVYFYDGSGDHVKKNDNNSLRIDEDMVILWRLKKLGIPIMPILSGGNNTTSLAARARGPRSQQHHHQQHQPQHHHYPSHFPSHSTISSSTSTSSTSPIISSTTTSSLLTTSPTVDERRTRFADLLAQYKIRCVDISLSKLDVGRPPSFQKRKMTSYYYPSKSTIPGLEERLGQDWAASSMTTPAPYQILTIDQFAALDRQIVFSILKQSRQKALKREKVLSTIRTKEEEQLHRHQQSTGLTSAAINNTEKSDLSWIITSTGNVLMNPNTAFHQSRLVSRFIIILIFISIILFFFGLSSSNTFIGRPQQADIKKDKSWNLTAFIGMATSQGDDGVFKQSLSFVVELGDESSHNEKQAHQKQTPDNSRYECKIALPTYISQVPNSPLAKLDIQFPYPVNFTHLDLQCPLLHLPELAKGDRYPEADYQQLQKTPKPKKRGYWGHIYATTNYLLHHSPNILNLVFNSK